MQILIKEVTLGEKKFKVATDRDIAVKSFEAFPDLIEYLIKKEKDINNEKVDDKEFFLNAIKNKELGNLFDMENKLGELIAYALPLMLVKANDNSSANEIIDYAKENDVSNIFNNGMLEFLMQGFTQRGLAKPKIKFSMK